MKIISIFIEIKLDLLRDISIIREYSKLRVGYFSHRVRPSIQFGVNYEQ
ncbi:hypothetical protein VCR4J5_70008 [Vibrio crassostreae]|uniref:Uncharacterized protein n=1 Tax=Vibrio crassostreae TaxID=246167 RepID=A0ABM9QXI0_9VIBR|nr:hypothetical protein VCRA2110O182_10008 [Vibrio crassostreae]CAK2297660.1 hypothetical protein VCRA211O406_10008 [Vibrio crassostreae]CAK2710221.1 hypothetical protein VCRA2110O2_230076 [Vibrio crassostreae]CDT54279.1 hypothetical protein VCR4J5_70008 [Vibrio crassostreae]